MNKIEAIEAMKQGHKVTHEWFSNDEYIYMKNGEIYDENDYKMSCIGANNQLITFWTDRTHSSWIEGGWSIYVENVSDLPGIGNGKELVLPFIRRPEYNEPIIPRTIKYDCISKNSHKRSNKRKKR